MEVAQSGLSSRHYHGAILALEHQLENDAGVSMEVDSGSGRKEEVVSLLTTCA